MDTHHDHLRQQVAYLEMVNDQLATEINYVDELLRLVGFEEGLATVKEAAHELLTEMEEERGA